MPDRADIFEAWPGPVIELCPDGSVLRANELGRELAPILLASEPSPLRDVVALAFEAGGSVSDHLAVTLAGKPRWYLCIVMPHEVTKALVLMRDETYDMNVRQALFESRQRYRDLVVISSDFAWETDAEGVFVFVSPHGALGYSAEDLVGHRPDEFLLESEARVDELPFATRTPVTRAQIWLRNAEGEEACLVSSAVPVVGDDGAWCGARGLCRDVTEERLRDAALAQSKVREQVVAYIVDQMRGEARPEAMLEAAVAMLGRAASAAAAVYQRTGRGDYEPAATSANWPAAVSVDAALAEGGDGGAPFKGDVAGHRVMACVTRYHGVSNGLVVLARSSGADSWSADDEATLAAVAGQLAIALRQIADQRRLEEMSNTDELTGLLNRRAFLAGLDAAIARTARNAANGALIFVDLDNFKAVNDNFGHETGDQALIEVADILRARSRSYDLVARLGGDEFVVWLDGVDSESAGRRVAELAAALAGLSRFSKDVGPPLGASLGIAEYDPGSGDGAQQLIARADRAMYDAKDNRKRTAGPAAPGDVDGGGRGERDD